jgi:nitrogenase molybdenum-iron protein alpha/beta subunit
MAVEEEKPDLIIGGLYETEVSKIFGIPLLDVMHGEKKTMGFEGAVNLAKNIGVILLGR